MLDHRPATAPVWLSDADCDLGAFRAHVERTTQAADYPHAAEILRNVPVYDGDRLRAEGTGRAVMAEWNRAFATGPGIIAIRRGYADTALVDAVTEVLIEIIAQEAASGDGKGDHFASAGSNARVWNAHEKLAMADPALFVRYTANTLVPAVAESWLGPLWQMTTQVNLVRPGGKAQTAHRDYHMGFQTAADLASYPAAQHGVSALLTLQGAVAHSDMPVVSGPTKLLPYSQSYLPGYLAVLRPEFRAYFEANHVQLPLEKGDLLFFNPATFHGAGENRSSDIQRFANLMQIGSGYGRSIEIVDRSRLSRQVYPALVAARLEGAEREAVIANTGEGYPFPANLDIDSPLTGMAPPSQQDLLRQALSEGWPSERFDAELAAMDGRKRSH